MGATGATSWGGPQGNMGITGSQGFQGAQGVAIGGISTLIGYSIKISTNSNGYTDGVILGASSSTGNIIYGGGSWSSGWSNDIFDSGAGPALPIKIYHPLGSTDKNKGRILNLTTHGLNGATIYSIPAFGKSTADTQHCTLIQDSNYTSFTIYGCSYLSTSCSQLVASEITITFQVEI